jgi:hypothetical protein
MISTHFVEHLLGLEDVVYKIEYFEAMGHYLDILFVLEIVLVAVLGLHDFSGVLFYVFVGLFVHV